MDVAVGGRVVERWVSEEITDELVPIINSSSCIFIMTLSSN